ncbi:malate dehydrogenase [Psychromonas sp. PT13]|uniref:malate dehydrogenase n=1 Tax=Psychromonas sp. PT13 TaxID=3439547 RepID=UPI003EBE8221
MKVAVIGAAGGIGQALSLLLKINLPENSILSLYDTNPMTPGVAKDLSHIPTSIQVEGYSGDDGLKNTIKDANVIIICAGIARKPGMDRADLFNNNANTVKYIIENIAEISPNACIGIITNPINTLVALAAEVLKKANIYDKRKLFGITTLDIIRAEDFIAEEKGIPAEYVHISVIGGHSGKTILPVLSQVQGVKFTEEEVIELTKRIQNAGTEVIEAKAGSGSATLSMAHAASIFCVSLVKALLGKQGIIENAYVDGGNPCSPFFTQPLLLGVHGIERVLPFGELSPFEEKTKQDMIKILHADIQKGIDFIKTK